MLIAVDIGNTNIVVGLIDSIPGSGDKHSTQPDPGNSGIGFAVRGTYRITTRAAHTSDEYGLILGQFLAHAGIDASDVDDVIVASVVPNVMHSFTASIRKYLNHDPVIVTADLETGLTLDIEGARSLGADCLADCVGAYHRYGGPLLVADFGTATTYNYVTGQGAIVSGLITPGILTAASTLWSQTAQLPEFEITRPTTIMARNTVSAMQAGLYHSFLGGVERIIGEFHNSVHEDFKVITTGGLGGIVAHETPLIDVYDPNLIFEGMAIIYQRNSTR